MKIERKAELWLESTARRKHGKVAMFDDIELTGIIRVNRKFVFMVYTQIYIDGWATNMYTWEEHGRFKTYAQAHDYWFNYCYTV